MGGPLGCCSITASTCCLIPLPQSACPAPRCCLLIYGQKQEPGKCDSRLRSCLVLQCLCLSQGILAGARAVAPLALHSAGTPGPKQWLYKGRPVLRALPLIHHYPPSCAGSGKGFPKVPSITPPPTSPQWPNHEVGLVPARLWAWSPLSSSRDLMGWPGPRDPGWGPLLSPGALQGLALAGVAPWGGAVLEGQLVQWGYCRKGGTGLGLRVLSWWVASIEFKPPRAPCIWGQSPAFGDPPCIPRALGQNPEWPRPKQLNLSWQQQVLPVCQYHPQCQCSPCSSSSLVGARRVGSSGRVASVPPAPSLSVERGGQEVARSLPCHS